MADAAEAISQMLRDDQPRHPARLQSLATEIETRAGGALMRLFPEGSLQLPGEALPAIWSDPGRFATLAQNIQDEAATPAASVVSKSRAKAAFADLSRTCVACHEDFRLKKD